MAAPQVQNVYCPQHASQSPAKPRLQATGLRYMFEASPSSSTGCLLRELEAQHSKSCDQDMGGCGMPNSVNHFLERAPRVFTLQLTWESHSEQPADIAATLAAIDEEVGGSAGWQASG